MNISQPISSAIESVDFAFLSTAEIKALSVKRIQNGVTFDSLLHPVPEGLYDPALGAWGDNVYVPKQLLRLPNRLIYFAAVQHVISTHSPVQVTADISIYPRPSTTPYSLVSCYAYFDQRACTATTLSSLEKKSIDMCASYDLYNTDFWMPLKR